MPKNIEPQGVSKEKRKQKIKELGFSNEGVIKYLTNHFTIEKIQEKIQSLQSAGFKDPVSLIEKFPPIAGLNINRVKRKIRLIERLNTKFQLQLNPVDVIKSYPPYLGYDLKRIFFYLRVASLYNVDEKFYRKLITENPFIVYDILYDLYSQNKISDKDEFERLINKILKFPKETKKEIQDKIKNNLPKIIEELKQTQDNPNIRFLLKLASYLEVLLRKERKRKRR